MDLIVMLIFAVVITVIGIPYMGEQSEDVSVSSLTETVICNSTFVVEDLPYCNPANCSRQKCFTYYQEVLGLWR